MKIKTHSTLTMDRDDDGYRFAKEWCERRQKQHSPYTMEETSTSIILEEEYITTVRMEDDDGE